MVSHKNTNNWVGLVVMFERLHIYFKTIHPVGYFCLDKTRVRTCGALGACGASDTWRACAVLGACCVCT